MFIELLFIISLSVKLKLAQEVTVDSVKVLRPPANMTPIANVVQTSVEYLEQEETESDDVLENKNQNSNNLTRRIDPEIYQTNILWKYHKNGVQTFVGNAGGRETLDVTTTGCSPTDKFTFIFHGFRENCNADWIAPLISKLTSYRGGCIVCVDYGLFAAESYIRLIRNFPLLTETITGKLKFLHAQGFDPAENGYMFGFSYGGQLACAVGQTFGPGIFKEIDTCDMAGIGFDYRSVLVEHREAAQNVQCIHTSGDKGTRIYKCHQNWRMGNCGLSQLAAAEPPLGSHGLCTRFYINSFDYDFIAIEKPISCRSKNFVTKLPPNYKMGPLENRKSEVQGELFSLTGPTPPYNVILDNLHPHPLLQAALNQPQQHLRSKSILNSIREEAKKRTRLRKKRGFSKKCY